MPRRSLRSLLSVAPTLSLPQIAQLHQHLLSRGLLLSSPFLLTKLLTVYASLGDLPCTLRLFSLLPHPRSLFAWTPLLSLLSRSSLHLLCLSSYSLLRSSPLSPAPDPFLFPPVLRSAAAAPAPAAPRLAVPALHADALKFASDGPLPVANALVSAYARRGDLAAARRAFDLIPARRRDLLSWNSVLAAYAAAAAAASGGLPELELLLRSMRSQGLEPDLVTWNTLMDGYCRAGRCDEARDILLRGAPDPNAVSWTTVISGYARAANHEASLRLFQRRFARRRRARLRRLLLPPRVRFPPRPRGPRLRPKDHGPGVVLRLRGSRFGRHVREL
ncbi:pentatricopeptide repeat-containing protein At1g19720-like [Ananas comosus]|uniref:Pentatricopeptide repeat-containing protein At1g19720-like n=1 Tax=Ananas comosus TaxID=4615 RepID=A0A6P5G8W8_ANACO|nr:pentatricopeptide repeat-containing protein At1g19720-like [Ananas comosus]